MVKNIVIVVLLAIIGMMGIVGTNNPQIKSAIVQMMQKKDIQKAEKKVPNLEEVSALTKESMQAFSKSLKQKNMKNFYNNIAKYWQEKTSVKELNKVFVPFIKAEMDLSGLSKLQPFIEKGSGLTKEGNLLVSRTLQSLQRNVTV